MDRGECPINIYLSKDTLCGSAHRQARQKRHYRFTEGDFVSRLKTFGLHNKGLGGDHCPKLAPHKQICPRIRDHRNLDRYHDPNDLSSRIQLLVDLMYLVSTRSKLQTSYMCEPTGTRSAEPSCLNVYMVKLSSSKIVTTDTMLCGKYDTHYCTIIQFLSLLKPIWAAAICVAMVHYF